MICSCLQGSSMLHHESEFAFFLGLNSISYQWYVCTVLSLVTQSRWTLCYPANYSPPGSSVRGILQGRTLGVGCHARLQGIFPIQGSNPGLLHCRWIPYHLSHQGSPRILEWVAYPFSRESSQPRNRTRVSSLAGRVFTS